MSKIIVSIVAIVCITILEVFAMSQGFNGVALAASCSVIAGLGGYHVKNAVVAIKKPPQNPPK